MVNRKRLFRFLLKGIVSTSIIAYLLIKKITLKEVIAELSGVDLGWIVLSFSLHSLGLIISAYRWRILAEAQGDQIPFSFLAKSYLVGSFFNNILPTRFGGDIVRIWDGSKYSQSLVKSSAIVLVERLTGILVLFFFALLASIIRLPVAHKMPLIWGALLISGLGLLAIAAFFLPFSMKILDWIPGVGLIARAKQKIILLRDAILFYKQKKGALLKATFWALLLQVNVILHYYLLGKALHLKIQLIDYFFFIPVVLIILIIPITINGLGLREGSYIGIFNFYGISNEAAFSFSLVDVTFGILVGIVGGIIYVTRK